MPIWTDKKHLHVACVKVLQYVMHADQRCILYTCHSDSASRRKVTVQMAQVYKYVYIEERVFMFLFFSFCLLAVCFACRV